MLYAAILPPMSWITGWTRWEIHAPFSALGFMTILWVGALPILGPILAGLRLAGPAWLRARPWAAAIVAWALAVPILALTVAVMTTGGPSREGFGDELVTWALLFAPACAGQALCLDLAPRAARRWRVRVERRAAPDAG